MPDEITGNDSPDSFFDTNLSDVMGNSESEKVEENHDEINAKGGNKGTTQDSGNGEIQVQGFEKNFFDEKGEIDLNGAMNFVTSNTPQKYDVQDIVTPMRAPLPVQPTQPVLSSQPNKEPWEIEYEAERTERENHFKPYTMYREFLQKASEEGYQCGEIWRRANELAQEAGEKEWARLRHKREYERRQSEQKRVEGERSFSELIPKSRSNLGVMYSRFKDGENGFNSLVFGGPVKDQSGKVIGQSKGFATDFINYAFKLENRGKEVPKDPNSKEFKEFADKWWVQFTSDPQNLEHMMDFAVSKLNLHLQRHSSNALKKMGAAEEKRLSAASQKGKPGTINRKQPIESSEKKENPFQSIMNEKDFVDSI